MFMGSSSRWMDMKVWNSGLRPGPEMEIQTPLMYREQVDWHGCMSGVGRRGAQGGGDAYPEGEETGL